MKLLRVSVGQAFVCFFSLLVRRGHCVIRDYIVEK